MNIEQLKEIIEKQESLGLSNAVLVITKSKNFRQTSKKLRTAFGMCDANWNGCDENGFQRFIIFAPIIGMKKYLNRIEAAFNKAKE